MAQQISDDDKALLMGIMNYISTLPIDPTSMEIVQQTLSEQVGVDPADPLLQSKHTLAPFGLLHVFQAGRAVLASQQAEFDKKMLPKLQEQNYFGGATEGSADYNTRLAHARMKFLSRQLGSKGQPSETEAPKAAAPAADAPKAVDFAKAEEFKSEGNAHLAAKRYPTAISAYSRAIELNPGNNIYFANRALANIESQQFQAAVDDCKASIALDAFYSKAHYRLGLAHLGLRQHQQAIDAFEHALACNTGDSSHIHAKLAQARAQLSGGSAAAAPAAANPFAGLAGLGGAGGANPFGGLDLGALMSNPAIAQMAQQVMSNPDMMGNIMNMMGGASGAQGGDGMAEQLQQFLNSPQAEALSGDPTLGPVLADVKANGPMAAMKYMNDPAVMAKLSALMGGQQ